MFTCCVYKYIDRQIERILLPTNLFTEATAIQVVNIYLKINMIEHFEHRPERKSEMLIFQQTNFFKIRTIRLRVLNFMEFFRKCADLCKL